MNPLTLAILLQLAGILIVIAEIIIPSGGIISIIAFLLFGYSLLVVFQEISTSVGVFFVAADIVIIPMLVLIGLKLLAKSPVMLKKELSSSSGVISQSPDLVNFIEKEGVTLCDLHPAGQAEIEGEKVDVISRGEYIEKNSTIIVASVTGNQIIVQKKV